MYSYVKPKTIVKAATLSYVYGYKINFNLANNAGGS